MEENKEKIVDIYTNVLRDIEKEFKNSHCRSRHRVSRLVSCF